METKLGGNGQYALAPRFEDKLDQLIVNLLFLKAFLFFIHFLKSKESNKWLILDTSPFIPTKTKRENKIT